MKFTSCLELKEAKKGKILHYKDRIETMNIREQVWVLLSAKESFKIIVALLLPTATLKEELTLLYIFQHLINEHKKSLGFQALFIINL